MRISQQLLALAVFLPMSWPAQSATRIVVLAANGPLEQANPAFALGENRLTEALRGKLAAQPGFTIVAQSDMSSILQAQNFQNSDRSSPENAARIGKLANAEYMIYVNLANGSQTSHPENTPISAKTIAVVQADAMVRIINVESATILAQPTATFQQSAVALETKTFPILKNTGPGLPQTLNDLWAKATESLSSDLSQKITDAFGQAPASHPVPLAPADLPKVAGIDSGSVFINKGSNAGIKVGDRFQITRMVATSLKDPDTGTPITKRQQVCVLTVATVEESNSSGSCTDGIPEPKDLAEPVHP